MEEEIWSQRLVVAVKAGAGDSVESVLKVRRVAIRRSRAIETEKAYGDQSLLNALFRAIREDRSEITKQLIKAKDFKAESPL